MNVQAGDRTTLPLIIGHRGASAVAPENTLAAFERALADGADGIEFDVRLARDRVAVVIHDPTLRRTALREAQVAALSSAELSRVDVGTWFNLRHPELARPAYSLERIVTLARVFEVMKERLGVLYVEMKCSDSESGVLAAEVARLVREYSLVERVVVESFQLEAIAEIKRLAPELRTAALFEPKLTRPILLARKIIAQATRFRADEIALHRALASRRTVAAARAQGLPTVVWTVDAPAWVKRGRDFGIHAIITNKPAQLRARLNRLADD
ncbi:MAG TPA: glycerophosphodiester phosphodiesterase family protein [Pyrinomonadaceae bacterium]|jgi:glycerophosphoryl diester phosphodiesterase